MAYLLFFEGNHWPNSLHSYISEKQVGMHKYWKCYQRFVEQCAEIIVFCRKVLTNLFLLCIMNVYSKCRINSSDKASWKEVICLGKFMIFIDNVWWYINDRSPLFMIYGTQKEHDRQIWCIKLSQQARRPDCFWISAYHVSFQNA